jgi:hypothetical protein
MPGFTFPTSPAGLTLELVIGVDGRSTVDLQAQGLPVPPPIAVPALIDTGSDVSVITPRVVAHLGLAVHGSASAQSTVGSAGVDLFQASMSIYGSTGVAGPSLVIPYLVVMQAPALPPGFEALVGMDVLAECLLLVDGPRRQFTLTF